MFLIGNAGFTTTTIGTPQHWLTGTRSLTGSKLIFFSRAGLLARLVAAITSV